MPNDKFRRFEERMRAHQVPELAVRAFKQNFGKYYSGDSGVIRETDIEPASDVPDFETLDQSYVEAGERALSQVGAVKLNGGLGTGMGLDKAKSLLPAKNGYSFLDVIAKQTIVLRQKLDHQVPMLLMNSFATHEDTLDALKAHPGLKAITFVQNKVPKVLADGDVPVEDTADGNAWCPPGHGDMYTALQTSNALQTLVDSGTEYLFVSNSDNLGAVLNPSILGYMVSNGLPFLMEVADRTEEDKKGGHLAQNRATGGLLLRESAQCSEADRIEFENISKHRYFNTNNIWLHVPSLVRILEEHDGVLPLSLIRNKKTLDPRDPNTPWVYQLETAMGSAISVIPGAGAIRVPRSRFAPVKTCNELLVLWSDAYVLQDDYTVALHPNCNGRVPVVELDPEHYKFVDQLKQRFPHGAPSLVGCHYLGVKGDISFGKGVIVLGSVSLQSGSLVSDYSILS